MGVENLFADNMDVFWRLFAATSLGVILGIERSIAGKMAGMRTYALVSLGSCLFIVMSVQIIGTYGNTFNFDPLRVAAGIVEGIGFLGAGVIIFRNSELSGLTTAAGMWVAAGIGAASGFALYGIAVAATALTLVVFTLLWFLEDRLKTTVADLKSDNVSVEKD